jgi:GNAT superfamily N-acetyltransferase
MSAPAAAASSAAASSARSQLPEVKFNLYTQSEHVSDDGTLDDVMKGVMDACSKCFSSKDGYGIWSRKPEHAAVLKALTEKRNLKWIPDTINMGPITLGKQSLFDDSCAVVVARVDGQHVGHAFYCTFQLADGRKIRWISQLVVDRHWRRRGIATQLLEMATIGKSQLHAVGLVTSNAAAVRALENAVNTSVSLAMNVELGPLIHQLTPIKYMKDAKPAANWASFDTLFFVDHQEPDRILQAVIQDGGWALPHTLPEGHEFLAIVPARRTAWKKI